MIPLIAPNFDALEESVLRTRQAPAGMQREALLGRIHAKLPAGNLAFAPTAEAALTQLLHQIAAVAGAPITVAMGTLMPDSVLAAAEQEAVVQLMDCNVRWQHVPDAVSGKADVVLISGWGANRTQTPARGHAGQIVIDWTQAFDGSTGFAPEADYVLLSFGEGAQMAAGGGAIVWSKRHSLTALAQSLDYTPPDWQLYLMASQLEKVQTLNAQRRDNALYLMDRLRNVSWLSLPDSTQNPFLKFTVRIDSGSGSVGSKDRAAERSRFIEHMQRAGVEVEHGCMPAHLRFPQKYPHPRYQDFLANGLLSDAISLACRPGLTKVQLDEIANAVISFRMDSPAADPQSNLHKFSHVYTSTMLGRPQADDYFGRLFNVKSAIVRRLGVNKRILEAGCGPGPHVLPLLADGYDVCGLDFAAPHIDTLRRQWLDAGGDPLRLKTLVADIASVPEKSGSYDLIFSFSTLYCLPDLDRGLDEIVRLLSDGGVAVLDFGNSRSLAEIESRRISTGVQCFYCTPRAMRKKLAQRGLVLRESHVFQIAPFYGGATPRDQAINAKLNILLAQRSADGRMLDQIISSSPILSPFAFRHILVAEKTSNAKDVAPHAAHQTTPANAVHAKTLVARGAELGAAGQFLAALDVYVQALTLDPNSVDAAFGIADLYEAPQEKRFAARARRLHRRLNPPLGKDTHAGSASIQTAPEPRVHPRVSIVLPTYNHIAFLPLAIDGVLSQTFTDFELIIVNDGSTDGTAAYLSTLKDKRITVIERANGGLPSALNQGFAAARGEYRTWTSADNVTAPTWLEKLVSSLDAAAPTVGLVCSGFAEIDEGGRLLGVKRGQQIEYDKMVAHNAGIASFLYRTSIAQRVGGYDTTLTGAEDWDMWLRILDVSDGLYVDDVLYYYRLHANSMTSTMRAKVVAASVAVVHKLHHTHGDGFNLTRFYPRLSLASNQPLAIWQAKIRLGAILMGSPFCPPGWAAVLLLDALNTKFSQDVLQSFVLLLCRSNAWDIAVQAVDDFSSSMPPAVSDTLRKRLVSHDRSLLQELSVFQLPDDALVFDLGREAPTKSRAERGLEPTPA